MYDKDLFSFYTAPSSIICKWSSPIIIRRWLLFVADGTCIFHQHEVVKKPGNILNKEFSPLCQCFIDDKQSIHFVEDKIKSFRFSKTRGLRNINISFVDHSINQHKTVEYLGCQLDSKLSGEAMASNALQKMNAKLKLLYCQSRYLTPACRKLLCNALIQPHFDYRCSSWVLLLKENLKLKLQKINVFAFA